jgi:hypothetical protein
VGKIMIQITHECKLFTNYDNLLVPLFAASKYDGALLKAESAGLSESWFARK